jgi:hypothetical protein
MLILVTMLLVHASSDRSVKMMVQCVHFKASVKNMRAVRPVYSEACTSA